MLVRCTEGVEVVVVPVPAPDAVGDDELLELLLLMYGKSVGIVRDGCASR